MVNLKVAYWFAILYQKPRYNKFVEKHVTRVYVMLGYSRIINGTNKTQNKVDY